MKEARGEGETFRDYYNGIIPQTLKNSFDHTVMVDFVYVDMKQSIATLYAKNPKFFMRPENPQSEFVAEVWEEIINTKWKELKMVLSIREGIKNAKLDGICGFKTYFNYKENYVASDWSGRQKNDDVCTEVVPLSQLIRDPDATSWETSPWIAHEITAKIDTIAQRFNIRGKEKDRITVNTSTKNSTDLGIPPEQIGDFQYGTYYEIEDREARKIYYLIDGIDRWAQKPKDFPKTPEGDETKVHTMWDFLSYNSIPGRTDPKSDYYFWKQHIDEVTIFRSMRISKALKGQSKIITRGSRITQEQKDQIGSNVENSVVELENTQEILPFPLSPLDPNIQFSEQAARADIQLISKQAPRQGGGGSDKTATEVRAIEQASIEVTSDARDQLDMVLESIAQKWVYLMQENYTSSRFISITGMANADFIMLKEKVDRIDSDMLSGSARFPFLKVNKNNLKHGVKVEIQSGSTMPDNDRTRIEKLKGFSEAVKALGLNSYLDPDALIDELVEVFGVRNENLTVKKDNPIEESKILQSGLFFAPRMSDNHDEHILLHERENKGTDEEQVHLMIHRIFKNQIEKTKAAQQLVSSKISPQVSGQSFMGDPQGQVGSQGLPQQPAPANPGQLGPQVPGPQPVQGV